MVAYFFFYQERWPKCLSTKILAMQVEFDNFFLFLLLFIISLINTQRFGAFSCYLQHAGGGRNRGGSLISQLCIPSLRFAFCFHIDLFLRGFFAHFPPYGRLLVAFLALSMHSALSSSSLQPSCPLPHHPGYMRQPSGLYPSHFINHSCSFFPDSSQGHFSSSPLPDWMSFLN